MPYLGKDIRLARLVNPKSCKLLAITVDHSIARGIMAGLIPIQATIDRIVAGAPDAVTMHKGIAEQSFGRHVGKTALILKCSSFSPYQPGFDTWVTDVEEGVRLGADAVSMGCIVGGTEQPEQLRQLGVMAKQAASFGMDYKNSSVINDLKNKDILWFAGGYPGYLMYWIRRCELDKALPELLEKSIYVGSSAASMITSKKLSTTEWYICESEAGASVIPGLGLVDFEIYPHYEDHLLPKIKKFWKKGELYLLKNGETITVVYGKVDVLGKKRVLIDGKVIK